MKPVNPFLCFVAMQQIGAGGYSLWMHHWKIGAVMILVGVANVILSYAEG